MVGRTRNSTAAAASNSPSKKIKQEDVVATSTTPKKTNGKRSAPSSTTTTTRSSKRIKNENPDYAEDEDEASDSDLKVTKKSTPSKTKPSSASAASLQAKKLKQFALYSGQSPFPDFPHPTPAEAKLAHKILTKQHGARVRPKNVIASTDRAGCGDSPSVLDALVRTILSQNTSDVNSSRAKKAMDKTYGGSDNWAAIVEGGTSKLEASIKCGGLSQTKSKVIMSILNETYEKYGEYSLDHMFKLENHEAMQEMISMKGVGPKTASCVLLFCLGRDSFAVDTHVHRITGLLGWRPASADREQTHAHLDVRIPDEDKYGLHVLLVGHGKKCPECKSSGSRVQNCELRKAFRKGKLKGEAGDEVKEEEIDVVKEEEEIKQEVKDEDEDEDEDEE